MSSSASGYPSAPTAWTVTVLLTVLYVFSFIDRQVLNLLVGPIQSDLDLTDVQVSLLQGFAFVSTYVVLSVPIGRLVDTRSRVFIISAGVAFWSLATAACGLAKNFGTLFVARAGVGIGEATLTPASWSLMADYFPPERRTLPFSVFLVGPYIGAGIAMIFGGLAMAFFADLGAVTVPVLGTLAPWQLTFIVVGAPGLLLALLTLLVPEPVRKGVTEDQTEAAPYSEILQWMNQYRAIYVALLLGVPCITLILYGLQAWIPTYLLRVQGMSLLEAGTQYGGIALVCSSIGVLSGPWFGQLLLSRGYKDYQLRVAMFSLAALIPVLMLLPLAASPTQALACIAVASFLVPFPLALIATAIQSVTPNRMRGVLVGAYVVAVNVIGLAMGPSLIAFTTDYVFGDPQAVGKSLALVSAVVGIIGVVLIYRSLAPLSKFLEDSPLENQ